ncbi:MAG: molybdopterin cofactor-binding domain-containing protein, partial [Alphaproteobacteria bacterium]
AYHRQVLFAVVARSRHAARAAVKLARPSTTSALPVTDLDEVVAANASLLVDYGLERGDPDDEIDRCDKKLSGQISGGAQDHFFLEPHTTLAIPTEGGGLQIICSCEDPAIVQRVVAEMLDLSSNAVVVETRRVGGGFGGKRASASQWAAIAALAAWRSGRPCKLRLDHAEGVSNSGKRQSVRINYKAGITREGVINAINVTFAARSGSGADSSEEINDRTLLGADNAYYFPALRILSRRLRSNNAPGALIRGAGNAEGSLFAERLMDHIAVSLGQDPLDVRKTNLYGPGRDRTPYSLPVEDNILGPLVNELERTSEYRRRRREIVRFNQTSPILKKGLSLVPVKSGVRSMSPIGGHGSCLLQIYRDGTMRVALSAVEEGQGLSTKAAQIVAEEFGIRHQEVKIGFASTTSVASDRASSTDAALMAVIKTCHEIKDSLYDFVEETMRVERERVEFRDGRVRLAARHLDFAELIAEASAARVPLSAMATHTIADISWDRERLVGRPFHYFAYGAACAEVTVDTMTGERRIDRIDILQDVGRSLNPAIDTGLLEGGFAFGLGWLTSEEPLWDSTGRLRRMGAADYAIPTVSDIPADYRVAFYQTAGAKEETPYRSKDIEDAAVPLALSVFCAIGDAIGSLRPGTLPRLNAPATPEAIMRAVRTQSGSD